MINVEIIKVHSGQILPCGRVTGNKEFTIGGLSIIMLSEWLQYQGKAGFFNWIFKTVFLEILEVRTRRVLLRRSHIEYFVIFWTPYSQYRTVKNEV